MPYLSETPLDPGALLAFARRDGDGGLALFVGVVRNHSDGHPVDRLEYEAYGPMAEREMERISKDMAQQYPTAQVLFQHRVGSLEIGGIAVAVAAAAPHREEAFAACRAGIEAIKARVPIWKREFGPGGSTWVEPCGQAGHVDESD